MTAWDLAAQVKAATDVELPHLPDWNYAPCSRHEAPTVGCRQCGLLFRAHQRVGIAWSYVVGRGGLFDPVGTGKTPQILGNLALRRLRGELSLNSRAVIVVRNEAFTQWQHELQRCVPTIPYTISAGTIQERAQRYTQPWEVCLITETMLVARGRSASAQFDYERLLNFPIRHLYVDDVNALRNWETETAYAVKRLGEAASSALVATASPLQKRLVEIYSVLEVLGGSSVFGTRKAFERRYLRRELQEIWVGSRGRGRRPKKRMVWQTVGHQNMPEFRQLLEPFVLRRETHQMAGDVRLPKVVPNHVELELYPRQRDAYKDLKRGVQALIATEGRTLKRPTAMGRIHQGARICAGLPAAGLAEDGRGVAVKADWVMDKLTGDLADSKVLVFIYYKETIRHLFVPRLEAAGIRHVIMWGNETDKDERQRRTDAFWDDPECKVLLGTTTIEQSLNFQVAQHLICVDQILNPQRMEQLAGRIRRDGSLYDHVYVHTLTTVGTHEESILPLLEREQALVDWVWEGRSELFDSLNPLQLAQLIGESAL